MINFNSKDIKQIKINNQYINAIALKRGTQTEGIWGKLLSKTITAGTGAPITINRTSSPYQRASTGNIDYATKDFYWGDVLRVSCTASAGYTFSKFQINGISITTNPTTVTCFGDSISISSVATKNASSWHTIFSGTLTTSTPSSNTTYSTFTYTISGLNSAAIQTRVTGALMAGNTTVTSFTNANLPLSISYKNTAQKILAITVDNKISFELKKPFVFGTQPSPPFYKINKIEQYY